MPNEIFENTIKIAPSISQHRDTSRIFGSRRFVIRPTSRVRGIGLLIRYCGHVDKPVRCTCISLRALDYSWTSSPREQSALSDLQRLKRAEPKKVPLTTRVNRCDNCFFKINLGATRDLVCLSRIRNIHNICAF